MPRLIWSKPALQDLARLRNFLVTKNPDAARRAIAAIRAGLKPIRKHPEIGRVADDMPSEIREWIIDFGQAAYIVRYHYHGQTVLLLSIRHSREAGY